jgi:hypothetical protein
MGGLAAVTVLDGRVIGEGKVGAVTRRLSELYGKETASAGYVLFEDVLGATGQDRGQ